MGLTSTDTRAEGHVAIAGYRLDEAIGEGGMGIVFKATQLSLDRIVALKVIKSSFAADPQFRARFWRESRAAAAIDHPNIVPVYDSGESDGALYLAMRYVDGVDLGSRIKTRGRLPASEAAAIVAQVAAALDAAHIRGLIHRDVKPRNVLIDAREHVYLTDFGLAKFGLEAERELTSPGQAVGSLDYMAPEQIRGEAIDPRTDVYALGCVLYESLTGQAPFADSQGMRVLWAHLQEPPPPPSTLAPDLPPAFDSLVGHAMAKEPGERYATAGALAEAALAAAGGQVTIPPMPSATPALGPGAPPPLAGPAIRPDRPEAQTVADAGQTFAPEPEAEPIGEPRDEERVGTYTKAGQAIVPSAQQPIRFRLHSRFRYVHQPLEVGSEALPLLGNRQVADALVERISYSSGGSFLITGFRGVGKTTVIAHALARLATKGRQDPPDVLPVFLNVARPRSTEELLFEVIRRLFEALVDAEILPALASDVQRKLILAYTRTSLSFKESRSNAVEHVRSLGVSAAVPLLEAISPKLDLSRKTTDSLATEASFLAYSDADVEHDFLRIVSLFRRVGDAIEQPRGWRERLLHRPARMAPSPPAWTGKVIVVIDELDKLTAREDGMECIESLLSGLKNLLTTTGVHFLFVAGPDLGDMALRHSHRGNSVYDSVFGWQLYVPCVWEATDQLLDAIIEDDPEEPTQVDSLRAYLNFKARGVPRLLLMEVNSLVGWDGDTPYLTLQTADLARIEFYAGLQRILDSFLTEGGSARPFSVPIDEDRWRLGAYYVTDRILKTIGATFTVDDIVAEADGLSVDPLLVLSPSKVQELLDHLVRNEVLERVRRGGAGETYFGDAPQAQTPIYRVAENVGVKLSSFARVNERERAELAYAPGGAVPASAHPWEDSVTGRELAGRYELQEEVDRGGMGRVYRAHDRHLDRRVAVKILDSPMLLANDQIRARFSRKAEIATKLDHPNIVTTYDVFIDDDGHQAVVMEYIEGTSLEQLLKQVAMTPEDAIAVAAGLLDALGYLNANGLARLDLKPTSIVLDQSLRPIIVDLGLAKHTDGSDEQFAGTQAGVVVGTPAYAAPEQLLGESVDIRTDLYSLALIICELISAKPLRAGAGLPEIVKSISHNVDLGDLPVSPQLKAVLERALRRDPEERFSAPEQMREALQAAPEAHGSSLAAA